MSRSNSPLDITALSYSLYEVTSSPSPLPASTAPPASSTSPPASYTALPVSYTAPPVNSTTSRPSKRGREETVELIEEIVAKRMKERDQASIIDLTRKITEQSQQIEMQAKRIDHLEEQNSSLEEEVETLRSDLEDLKDAYDNHEAAVWSLHGDLHSFWQTCRETFPDF